MDNTDKLDDLIRECRFLGLGILPPDINQSGYQFRAGDQRTIRYGLGAIKGLGQSAIDMIVHERDSLGVYRDLADFCNRIDPQKANRRAIDVCIRSGAMDQLDPENNRARLAHELNDALSAAEQLQRDREAGQVDLFGQTDAVVQTRVTEHQAVPAWTFLQALQGERDALGLYLTGHPTQAHAQDLARLVTCRMDQIADRIPLEAPGSRRKGIQMTLAGLVHSIRRPNGGGHIVTLEDRYGRVEMKLFDDAWSLYAGKLSKGEMILVEGRVSADSFSGGYRMAAQRICTLAEAKSEFARGVLISVRSTDETVCSALQAAFMPYRNGSATVYIDYSNNRARARLELGEDWAVKACDELVLALADLDAVSDARLMY